MASDSFPHGQTGGAERSNLKKASVFGPCVWFKNLCVLSFAHGILRVIEPDYEIGKER